MLLLLLDNISAEMDYYNTFWFMLDRDSGNCNCQQLKMAGERVNLWKISLGNIMHYQDAAYENVSMSPSSV